MITCSRCGKENQDLYKFCLGCGAKLQAAAAAVPKAAAAQPDAYPPTPPPQQAPAPLAAAKPVPARTPGEGAAIEPQPGAASPDSGVPPAAAHETDFASPPTRSGVPPVGASPAGPSPRSPSGPNQLSGPSVQIGIGSVPMQVPVRQSAAPTATNGPAGAVIPMVGGRPITTAPASSVPTAQTGHASPFSPPPVEMVPCPNCGKQVAAAFAFCGGCGHRMKPAPGAVGEAAIKRAEAVAPVAPRLGPRGHITLIRPDGTEGGVFPIQEGENLIGRGQGSLFDADPYLSPRHAVFFLTEAGLEVRDHRSLNGVFVRITEEEPLESGDTFRIGQELLRFDVINPITPLEDGTEIIGTPNPGYWGRLSVVVGRDLDGPAFPLFEEVAKLGRERGDILFPEDGYVSGSHCQLSIREGRVYLKDLGSSNGTFLRVRESRTIPSGSLMLMGQQLFRVMYK